MAERRMFARTIIDSDAFLDMPSTAQLFYFHLGMRADDDGFINNAKMIQRIVRASDDDMTVLIAKKFIIPFENGIVVIKHWKMNNYIQTDRYKPTKYKELLETLSLDENNAYTSSEHECIQPVYEMDTQVRLGKVSIGKVKEANTARAKHKHGEFNHVLLTDEEYDKLLEEYSNAEEIIKFLDEYIEMSGRSYKSHYMAIKKWVVQAVQERKQKPQKGERNGKERNQFGDIGTVL